MTYKKFRLKKALIIFLACIVMFTGLCFSALGADDFEKSIEAFPESYKPYLRELHEKYPQWEFVPFKTGLNWKTVIDKEYGVKNLIYNSTASENLKSRDPGHYNPETDTFIQKDSGFVVANRIALEYFMDPRNFLNEEGIFQFEQLSFSDSFSVGDVESILTGTFMGNSFIKYYNADGKLIETKKKYAEVIYQAGKKYDVNPCYLASKIRNEVGADGSASVSGTHSVYPGVYNFYNIGATDGSGAITRGLQWANGGSDGKGTSYGRPWNTPEKSIMGGAEYIAASYIGVGQFTGYLQKFNVNPDCEKPLYEHQYMTNVTGALSQGYTNYTAYAKTGSLYDKYIFSIPVYENMPSENIDGQWARNADSIGQTAKISVSSTCRVRTGPSTGNAQLTDSKGKEIWLENNQAVEILSKTFTDSDYYINILKYPHWVKIRFTLDSKTYEGYVPEDFVTYTAYTNVTKGEYKLNYILGDDTALRIVSSDNSVAKVTSDNTVNFLKTGTVYLSVYDSVGRYDIVKYVVTSSAASPGTLKATPDLKSIKATATATDNAVKYIYAISNQYGEVIATAETKNLSNTFKSLTLGHRYTIHYRAVVSSSGKSVPVVSTATATKPNPVSSLSITLSGDSAKLTWKKLLYCSGYVVYGYNAETEKYTKISTVAASKTSYSIPGEKLIYDSYAMRAYVKNGSAYVYGSYSDKVSPGSTMPTPDGFGVSAIKTNGYTLSWNKVSLAEEYTLYKENDGKWEKLLTTSELSYTFDSLEPGCEAAYKLTANKGSNVSEYTQVLYAMTLPEKVTAFKAENVTDSSFTLSWEKAQGASAYNIYLARDGEYKLFGECSSNSYGLSSLGELSQYTFRVAAVAKSDNNSLVGAFSEEISVMTLPSAVKDLAVKENKGKSVTVCWTAKDYEAEYSVYFYDKTNKKYTLVTETDGTEAVIDGLSIGTQYRVCVRCTTVKNSQSYVSDYSEFLVFSTIYPRVESFSVKNVKANSYRLTWEKSHEAAAYDVYVKNGDSFKKLVTTENNYYDAKSLSNGEKATYKLKAVYKKTNKTVRSDFSREVTASTLPGKVASFKGDVGDTSITFTWNEVKGADYYNLSVYEDGGYVVKASVKENSYTLEGLRPGATYTFAVRAFIDIDTGLLKSSSITKLSLTTKPGKVTRINLSSATSGKQTISWPAAMGANYYYIYRYSGSAKKYVLVAETAKRSYSFSGLSAGTTYGYKIQSAVIKGSKVLSEGSFSSVYKFSTDPGKVTALKATAVTYSKVSLSWKAVKGASFYEISYYSPEVDAYILAGTSTKNSYNLTGLTSSTEYKLQVRAVRTYNSVDYTGNNSSVLAVRTK